MRMKPLVRALCLGLILPATAALARAVPIPVIASGGIMDADSACEKISAGAQLLQIYTGLIYRGPGLLRDIAEALP